MGKRLRPAFPPLHEMALPGQQLIAGCLHFPSFVSRSHTKKPLRESFFIQRMLKLFCDLSYNACAYGTAAFTDSETLAFFHSAIGVMSLTLISTLSPGMHISCLPAAGCRRLRRWF